MSQIEAEHRRYSTLQDAASYMGGVSVQTVRRMIADQAINGYRLPGRSRLIVVDLDEIDAALKPIAVRIR